MAITTRFSVDSGLRRLLTAHRDLDVYDGWTAEDRPLASASGDERELFDGYVMLLTRILGIAEVWWESTLHAQQDLGLTRDEAIVAAFDKRLAGPASHPAVIWVIRHFWLERAAQNKALAPGDRLRPEIALLQWLIDAGEDELVRLVTCMPYWPVGLDENGNWC